MQRLILWLYNSLMVALMPLLKLKLRRRAEKEALYGEHISERFGHYVDQASSGWVWIHAVSLGETRAAGILISQLRESNPGLRFLLTHGTATGRADGRKLLAPQDHQVWQPWDTDEATANFLRHFRPRIGIIMETEVWPQLTAAARAENIPMVLANARLSERSLRRMQWMPWLMRPAMGCFHEIWAQTVDDAERLRSAGGQDIRVLGNLKFDIQPPAHLTHMGEQLRSRTAKPVVMLASSREGEEDMLLLALAHLRSKNASTPNLSSLGVQWLIVPRHPQRFTQVQTLFESKGFTVSMRSTWGDTPPDADIWLGDSIGEMSLYYSLSGVALLGGSFENLGGQNLIEALACHCPVVMGPHTFNFELACQQAEAIHAAQRVDTMMQAVELAYQLTEQHMQLETMRAAARQWLQTSKGAAQQMADRAMRLLDESIHTQKP